MLTWTKQCGSKFFNALKLHCLELRWHMHIGREPIFAMLVVQKVELLSLTNYLPENGMHLKSQPIGQDKAAIPM
jgi:hypothetical protein